MQWKDPPRRYPATRRQAAAVRPHRHHDGRQGARAAQDRDLPKVIPLHFDDYGYSPNRLSHFFKEMGERGLADRVLELRRVRPSRCEQLPGVHGLVAVHQMQYSRSISASACGRAMPRSCRACTVATCRWHRLRPVLGPALDDTEVAVAYLGGHLPAAQPSSASGSSVRKHQFVGGHLAESGQYSRPSIAVPRGLEEIVMCRSETHLRPQWAIVFGEHPQRSVVERRVGHHVDDGRPGRQYPGSPPAGAGAR